MPTKMRMNPAMARAWELGKGRAEAMGAGLNVEVRRSSEWQRRDGRGSFNWVVEGEEVEVAAMLSRARHVFEVISAGIVLARFDRRYEADAFVQGFTTRSVRDIRATVARLRELRHFRARLVCADAA